MAVTSEYQPMRLVGDGSTARFDFAFRIFDRTPAGICWRWLKRLYDYDVKSDMVL